jgi:hypothetical protein
MFHYLKIVSQLFVSARKKGRRSWRENGKNHFTFGFSLVCGEMKNNLKLCFRIFSAFVFFFSFTETLAGLAVEMQMQPRCRTKQKADNNIVNKFAFIKRRRRLKNCDLPEAKTCMTHTEIGKIHLKPQRK